jgi:hydrogenase expression/formation protein HypE
MHRKMGKLKAEELQKLLSCVRKDSRVLVPPMVGYDSGVHKINGKYIVVATDPCTGVPAEWFGYLLINYAASDVALSGAEPDFCTVTLMGPKSTKPQAFLEIMEQTCQAANDLDIAIVRGHTGMYDSLTDVVGVATVYGQVELEKLITPAGTKPGDLILCTKPLGLETITNFALKHKALAQKLFGAQRQEDLFSQVRMQSCVREALDLTRAGVVHAMHDATEGGFVSAINELAGASGVGFVVDWDQIPVSREALALKQHFTLSDEQLLSMSSTGTIIGAVNPADHEKAIASLRKNRLSASFIGEFTQNKDRVLVRNGQKGVFPQVPQDPYDLILSGS